MSDRLNYNTLAPAAMKALGGVHVYLHSQADLPKNLIDLAYLRTSQINGCAYCIDMHSHDLIAQGVPVSKLLLVSAWHEAGDIFDMRERGVLFTMDFNSARDHLLNRWVRENCMREAHFDTAYVVEPLDLIRAEMCIQRA